MHMQNTAIIRKDFEQEYGVVDTTGHLNYE